MVDPNLFQKAVLQHVKGIKKSVQGRRYLDALPNDGAFDTHFQDASLDPDGKTIAVDEERIYQADCGDYLDSPNSFGGRCKLGLFVCRHHLENCPRNYSLGAFEWNVRPPIHPCFKRCWLAINVRRLMHWLFSPFA